MSPDPRTTHATPNPSNPNRLAFIVTPAKSSSQQGRSVRSGPAALRLFRDDLRDLGAAWHLVGRHDAPERAGRVGRRPLVVGVEAVAVGRENRAVLVDLARRELQLCLQKLLQLPLVGALVPGDAPEATRAPVADEVRLVEPGVVRDAEALRRAAEAVLQLRGARPGLLVRIFGHRQHADDRAFLAGPGGGMAVGGLVVLPAVVLAALGRGRLPVDLLPVVLADI